MTKNETEKYKDLIEICNQNRWLSSSEYDFNNYPYSFKEISDVIELKDTFEHGNWSIRQGFIFNNLAFVQQVNGGDEYLTLRNKGGKWESFESISFEHIIENYGYDYFNNYLNKMLDYCKAESEMDTNQLNGMSLT